MKQVNLYQCETCGTQYADKQMAAFCEENHKMPVTFEATKYISIKNDKSGYPVVITVKFTDGMYLKYKKI